MMHSRWQVLLGAGLPGLALAAWWFWLQADSEAPLVSPTPAPAVHPVLAPPPKLPPPLNPPAGKELPPVKKGGTSWKPDPAAPPAPVEAQRGAPDIPGAQPLHPPPPPAPEQ
jgi:hypothetical protein